MRLLEAAGVEFAEKGYEAARVRSICDKAGVNLAGVNYHFGDKERLYVETVIEAHRCGSPMIETAVFEQASPAEQLRLFVRHFLENVLAMREITWHHSLMLREMLTPSSACETLVRETIRPRFERLLGIMRKVCPEAEERRLHALAFSVIGQCLHYRVGRHVAERLVGPEAYAALDVDFLTDHITNFTLAALGLAPPFDRTGASAGPGDEIEQPAPAMRDR